MILFLLFQRRVLFDAWLDCGFSPWFAKIPFETCCDIGFQLFKIARFHGLPLSKIGALIFAYRHLQYRFSKRTDVSDPVPGFSSGLW
jgi:hypothetical protein